MVALESLLHPAFLSSQQPSLWRCLSGFFSSRLVELFAEIPEGQIPLLVAPSDAAFADALTALGLTAEEVFADTDLLATVISLHLIAVPSLTDTTGSTLNGEIADLAIDSVPATLEEFIASDLAKSIALLGSDDSATITDVIACDGGVVAAFSDTVLLPVAAPGPAAAPTPAPAPETPITTTIGGLVSIACPAIQDVLATPNFSILLGLLTMPDVAATEITIPPGEIFIAAPTNAAFQALLSKLDPKLAENATVVVDLLANHIGVAASTTTVGPATALSGAPINFWRAPAGAAPTAISLEALADDATNGAITDGDSNIAKVAAAVPCAAEGQYAFGIDKVLVPAAYEAALAPAAAPAPAPAPTTAPAPAPSSAGAATFGVAAAVAMVAAMLA